MTASEFFCRAEDECRPACAGGVFQGVARAALGGVHADRQGIIRHARADQAHGCHHGFGAGFAGELPVGSLDVGHRADGLGHDGGGGLDGVRVRFGADPDRAQIRAGSTPARFMALRAASIDMVMTSSSKPGTAFSLIGRPPWPSVQTRATSLAGRR